ncbi:MAG: hypothetical protein LBP53_06855 [Candidatus Peribacteria bacterium]|jgi:hypothetical protein|nr:hypothetical protein [Candidatus Peribacteria bacterium]
MFATFEPHHLLSITDPSIDTNKTYHQTFQGYQISAPNTRFFVLHKKIIKLIELKHIGDTMGVFYLLKRNEIASIPLNIESCIAASQLFKGWDEMKGEPYFFLPYFSPKAIAPTNAQLTALSLPTQLQQDEKGVIIATSSVKSKDIEALPLTKEDSLSFLF